MSTQNEINKWLDWRDQMRQKRRVMTMGEYRAWSYGGDAISSPISSVSFPGGLTILLNTPSIIGKVIEP